MKSKVVVENSTEEEGRGRDSGSGGGVERDRGSGGGEGQGEWVRSIQSKNPENGNLLESTF